jgi:hypothetical protein
MSWEYGKLEWLALGLVTPAIKLFVFLMIGIYYFYFKKSKKCLLSWASYALKIL